jgi:hypothetical protein
LEVARASFEECITVARNIGNPGALIASLLGAAMAATKLLQKQPDENGKEQASRLMNAICLLGAIPSLNQNIHMFFWVGWGSDVYEQAIGQLRGMTNEETWERAFAEGGALSMQQALSIALQELQR